MTEMALSGIKVVELSTWVAGPATGMFLSDFGADVIRVEPLDGDPVRGLVRAGGREVGAFNWLWELWNRGKRGLAVDIRQEEGRQIIHQLVEKADVFLSNLRPGSLKRGGMDYETLSGLNSRLVYANQTGYGPRGPGTEWPSFDEIGFWARSGIMSTLGEPDALPVPLRGAMGDHTTAIATLAGICLALFARERTGLGQQVETSLLATGLWVAGQDVQAYLTYGRETPRHSRKTSRNPLYNFYQCRDGKWVQLVMFETDRYWTALCRAIGREDLAPDPRFDSHQKITENNEQLISILDEVLATKTRDEWAPRFDEVGLVWGPVQTISDVVADPCVSANEYIVEYDHFSQGRIRGIACPVRVPSAPGRIKGGAPELGQHTEEILLELGHDWGQIEELKEKNVII